MEAFSSQTLDPSTTNPECVMELGHCLLKIYMHKYNMRTSSFNIIITTYSYLRIKDGNKNSSHSIKW